MSDPRKWVQIYEHLLGQIADGTLKVHDQCPPIRETAQKWGVTLRTATKAYHGLADQGYLRLYPGIGGYVVVSDRRLDVS